MTIPKMFNNDDYAKTLWLLLLITAVVILAGVGLRDPWPADEPRFVEVAKEMVNSGNWFFPMRGGELYPDKPPVFMWSIAALYWLTGNLSATFLIPNALASLLSVFCVYDIAAKLWNVKTARNAVLFLLIAPQFIDQAKSAQIDAMVACWITVAMYGLLRHFFYKASMAWYLSSWAFMGLGIITKGVGFLPLFFLLPVLVLHFSAKHRFSKAQVNWRLLLGPIAMLLVLAAWLLPMLYIANTSSNPDFSAYRDNILFKQTGERYANSWGHIKPWYYFVVSVIPAFWFPLYAFLFSKSFWRNVKVSPAMISLLAWVVLVVVFFSISPGKRGLYVLPALPMMALLMGAHVSHVGIQPWFRRVLIAGAIVFGSVFFVAAGLCFSHSHIVAKELGDDTTKFAWLFLVTGFVWLGVLVWKWKSMDLFAFAAVFSITWVIYSTWGYTLLNPIRTPAKGIMERAQQDIGPAGELGLTRFKEQFLLFSDIPLTHFSYLTSTQEQDRNAWLWMREKPNRFILSIQDSSMVCFDASKATQLGKAHGRHWILLGKDAMAASCKAPATIKRYHLPMKRTYQ
ncbi:ArnT family glycosyltransferase [Marinomonas pollencensis]|uniref:4-amino-4-deoxy-L-arabinose transferase-like glycosyltransferase n=1 Tax=Marinomonas pollencensis TaxID=491954 RepID=A0A3E0DSP0_9GAMM|nr:glycosyltransferase family 39 protein [Marinomonas pollencensis]REG86569.1 4-amino-4-deoxy-L-arabinose transferase-like glycosyltransferase [Marinomonas pollencensis]